MYCIRRGNCCHVCSSVTEASSLHPCIYMQNASTSSYPPLSFKNTFLSETVHPAAALSHFLWRAGPPWPQKKLRPVFIQNLVTPALHWRQFQGNDKRLLVVLLSDHAGSGTAATIIRIRERGHAALTVVTLRRFSSEKKKCGMWEDGKVLGTSHPRFSLDSIPRKKMNFEWRRKLV